MSEFLKALRPVKRRLRAGRFLQGAAAGFACGATAALILLVVSVFVPLEGKWGIAGVAAAGCSLLFAAGNALRPVRDAEAARTADRCGLQERAVTALEMSGVSPAAKKAAEMIEAQRRDACESLRRLDVRKIRLRVPKKLLYAGIGLLLLCPATLLIPGRGDRLLAERKALTEKTAPMAEQIDQAAAEDEKELSEKDKAELRKLTEELKRDLSASRDELEAMVALDKAESRLEGMKQKTAGDALNALADAMRAAGMEAEAQTVENGDAAALSTALSDTDLSALREAAEGLNSEAQQMAEQLAQAAESGEMTETQLQSMMAGQGGEAADASASALQQALSAMKASLGSGTQQSGQGSSGAGSGQQGQNGGGAGTGTTNEEQKGGGQSQQGSLAKGNRSPEYRETEYESIYDPEKAETSSRDVTTEQNSLGKDSVQIETGPGKGSLEGNVPFREVVGEYARQEAQAAESAHLNSEQQGWVDEYFRLLTDE